MFHIDPEKLISAIKARPSLYNRNDKMYYANKKQNNIKGTMWLEVAEEVYDNTELIFKDKVNFVSEVQKRWRSLRSCFARELAVQRREEIKRADGSGYMKRRKIYEYFNSMLFLKEEAESIEVKDNSNKKDATELLEYCTDEHIILHNGNSIHVKQEIKKEAKNESHNEIEETKRGHFEVREGYNMDQQFALSIVPSLRKLDSKRNLEAKIEILKAIQAVTYKYE